MHYNNKNINYKCGVVFIFSMLLVNVAAGSLECQAKCVASCVASPIMPNRVCGQVCRNHCDSNISRGEILAWEGLGRSSDDSGTYLNGFSSNEGCIGYGSEQCYKRCRLVNKKSIQVCKCACCSCSFGK